MDFKRNNEPSDSFTYIEIEGLSLYRPRNTVRKELRIQAEAHLRKSYKVGKYTEIEKINEILNYQFDFYNSKLQEIISQIFCNEWLTFTIFQYEISGEIAKKYKSRILSTIDYSFWRDNGPTFRQTADLLCDKFIEFSVEHNESNLDQTTELIYYDLIWICAENCIKYSSSSNFIFMLTNEGSYIEILPPQNEFFIETGNVNQKEIDYYFNYYLIQSNKDIMLRDKYIEGKQFEHDIKRHILLLDEPLKKFIGMSYSEIFFLLSSISLSTRPIISPDNIPMVDKEVFINELSKQGGFPIVSIRKLFNAITLTKDRLQIEPREAWNYKQKNRVSKKPFLEITMNGKKYLLWSNQKLQDFFTLLDIDITFKNFPLELTNNDVSKAIDNISNDAGKWFESQVKLNMKKLNILGTSVNRKIRSNHSNKEIFCQAGEIDFLGISEADSAIILLECKMINTGFEARSFRQDKDKFLKGENSYCNKLTRKLNWVLENFNDIKRILCENYGIKESSISGKVQCGFITYYTTLIPCFMDTYPCVSLVDFIDKYQLESKWPYDNGIFYTK